MLNIALVGAGGHSLGCHAPALRLYADRNPGRIALAAVCDLDPAKAARAAAQFGFREAVTTINALGAVGEARPDALVAILPIPVMAAITPSLLRLGIPLLIEKPLGPGLVEAQALCDAVASAGAADRVMVSLNRRFDPGVTMALEWLRRQGPMRHVHGLMMRAARTEPDFVWGTGIHLVDALWHAAGPLHLQAGRAVCPGGRSDTWRTAELTGRDGCLVRCDIQPAGGEWEERIRIAGDGYCVDIRTGVLPPWRVRAVRDMKLELEAGSPPGEPPCVANGAYAETAAFVDAVETGRPMPVTVRDALASSRITDAIDRLCQPER